MNVNSLNAVQSNSFFKNSTLSINQNKETNKQNATLNSNNNLNGNKKSVVETLQEQITKMTEKKGKILANDKLTIDEKKAQVAEVNENIKELEKQIQQQKMIEKQRELDKEKEASEKKVQKEEEEKLNLNGDTEKDGVIVSKSLIKLMQANNSLSNIHTFNATKGRLSVEASYLNMRNVHREPGSFNAKQLSKLRGNIAGLENASNIELKNAINNIKNSEDIQKIKTETRNKDNKEENQQDSNKEETLN